jgi:hypothetical protein
MAGTAMLIRSIGSLLICIRSNLTILRFIF